MADKNKLIKEGFGLVRISQSHQEGVNRSIYKVPLLEVCIMVKDCMIHRQAPR